MQTVLTQRV